jgi:ribosomal protein S18 acetylase RimI-like enzyme
MLGVRRNAAGKGIGRLLLDAVQRLSADDPGSQGVSLSTEDARNVSLYRHFGYAVVGEADVETMHTWVFYRPDA